MHLEFAREVDFTTSSRIEQSHSNEDKHGHYADHVVSLVRKEVVALAELLCVRHGAVVQPQIDHLSNHVSVGHRSLS